MSPLTVSGGHLVISRVDMHGKPEGLFLYHASETHAFDAGDRQMMETLSAVLAPALSSARGREEEEARERFERTKQERYLM